MRLLLISGSLREGSYNQAIINHIFKQCQNCDAVSPIIFNGLNGLPIFTPDLDIHDLAQDNSPKTVQDFRKAVKHADAVLIATPEYAFEIPGGLKNALDWLISSGELVEKPVGIITASTSAMGGESANEVLAKLAGILSAKVEENTRLRVVRVNKKIDDSGNITDEKLVWDIQTVLDELQRNFK